MKAPVQGWDAVERIRTEAGMVEDAIPPGAFTIPEYAERYKMSYKGAELQLTDFVRKGRLKVGKRRGKTGRWKRFFWAA